MYNIGDFNSGDPVVRTLVFMLQREDKRREKPSGRPFRGPETVML